MTPAEEPLEGTREGDRVVWHNFLIDPDVGVVLGIDALGVRVKWDSMECTYPTVLWRECVLEGRAIPVDVEEFL